MTDSERDKLRAAIKEALTSPAPPFSDLVEQEVKDKKAERKLRERFANDWFWVAIVQLIVVNLVFIAWAYYRGMDVWTLRAFLGATILEVFGILWVVTRYLFPKR